MPLQCTAGNFQQMVGPAPWAENPGKWDPDTCFQSPKMFLAYSHQRRKFDFVKSKKTLKISEDFPKIPSKTVFSTVKSPQKAVPGGFRPRFVERGPNDDF